MLIISNTLPFSPQPRAPPSKH